VPALRREGTIDMIGKYRIREMRDVNGRAYFLPQRKGWLFWHTITTISAPSCIEHEVWCATQEQADEVCCKDAKELAYAVFVKDHDVLP